MSTTVYGLFTIDDPKRIRYVGQTKQKLQRRLVQHRYQSKNTMRKTPVGKWIQKHKGKIGIKVLKGNATWNIDEIKLISFFRKTSTDLLNVCDGGMGNQKEFNTEEHKMKISQSMIGMNKSKQHCENISNGRKGIVFSEETRNKMRNSRIGVEPKNKGIKLSKEERINISRLRNGTPIQVINKHTKKIIGTWPSIAICSEELGIHRNSINNVLAGRANSVSNYIVRRTGV